MPGWEMLSVERVLCSSAGRAASRFDALPWFASDCGNESFADVAQSVAGGFG